MCVCVRVCECVCVRACVFVCVCAHVCVLNCCPLPSLSSDIDECDSPQTCGPESVCVNTDGAYRCDCKPGYRTSGLGRQCRGESLFVCVRVCVCVCVYV